MKVSIKDGDGGVLVVKVVGDPYYLLRLYNYLTVYAFKHQHDISVTFGETEVPPATYGGVCAHVSRRAAEN